MRWFARRLAFYVFAIWVALTINFLLPRLMPGSPLGGLLQHLTPSQLSANPGIVQTYEALLGGGHHSIWADYVTYLHRIAHFDFGISTSNYPTPVSEVIGRTLGAEHAQGHGHDDRRGLCDDGAREGPPRPPRDDALRGPERDPAVAERLRRALRERGWRPRLRRVHLQLPRRGLHAPAGRARERLRARAGHPRRPLRLRDPRESAHGRPQPRPRPAPAHRLMSQLDPTL